MRGYVIHAGRLFLGGFNALLELLLRSRLRRNVGGLLKSVCNEGRGRSGLPSGVAHDNPQLLLEQSSKLLMRYSIGCRLVVFERTGNVAEQD